MFRSNIAKKRYVKVTSSYCTVSYIFELGKHITTSSHEVIVRNLFSEIVSIDFDPHMVLLILLFYTKNKLMK